MMVVMMVLLIPLEEMKYESLLRRENGTKSEALPTFFLTIFFGDCILTSHGYRRRDFPDLLLSKETNSNVLSQTILSGISSHSSAISAASTRNAQKCA
jgi:hypothetical protein